MHTSVCKGISWSISSQQPMTVAVQTLLMDCMLTCKNDQPKRQMYLPSISLLLIRTRWRGLVDWQWASAAGLECSKNVFASGWQRCRLRETFSTLEVLTKVSSASTHKSATKQTDAGLPSQDPIQLLVAQSCGRTYPQSVLSKRGSLCLHPISLALEHTEAPWLLSWM